MSRGSAAEYNIERMLNSPERTVDMSASDTARSAYQSARAELIARIGHRDSILVFYLGAVGALLGVALSTKADQEILLAIPYLAFGAAVLVSQHNDVIGALGSFCRTELHSFLEAQDPAEAAPEWERSAARRESYRSSIWHRSLGHLVLLLAPSFIGLGTNWQHHGVPTSLVPVVWWGAMLVGTLALIVILRSHFFRRKWDQ